MSNNGYASAVTMNLVEVQGNSRGEDPPRLIPLHCIPSNFHAEHLCVSGDSEANPFAAVIRKGLIFCGESLPQGPTDA